MTPVWILLTGMAVVVGSILLLRLHAFLALILAALVVGALTPEATVEAYWLGEGLSPAEANELASSSFVGWVAKGFGDGCAKIGILIAMAAIIGKCLLDSGGAERVVLSLRNAFGEKRTPMAFSASAFTLGIPVFFDTVFYLLMPLGKALRSHTGRDYLLYILAIVAGATMAHSLVPPTPGPLFVAAALKVDVGVMILAGLVVGLATVTAGYLYAVWANKRWDLPLRPSAELSEDELEAMAKRDASTLPPLSLSLLPILLPVILIGGQTVAKAFGYKPAWLSFLGDKNIALILSAGVALAILAGARGRSRKELAASVQAALASGGVIILITAAGSAFGDLLRQTGIAGVMQGWVSETPAGILLLAFGVTAVVRTAQGSATVAMITSVGVVAPIVDKIDLPFHPVYLALAIGCGSKPISWMNDSGFWIIGRMTGMTEGETFRSVSVMMLVMAAVGLALTIGGATVFPMR